MRMDHDHSGRLHVPADSLPCPGMSSRSSLFSKVDPAGHLGPSASLLRESGLLLKLAHAAEKSGAEDQAAPAAAAKPKQGTLMKKLSRLITPKRKAAKSGAMKQPSLRQQNCCSDGKDHFELLLAQGDPTLGELLLRAGASFSARSTLPDEYHSFQQHQYEHQQEGLNSSSRHNSSSVQLGSSFGRIAAAAGQGHLKRSSLSRIWQQVGGSVFCGSGHLSTLAMDDMERLAPMPQAPSATYSGESLTEDMSADASYWQDLADSILKQQQTTTDPADEQQIDEIKEECVEHRSAETRQDICSTSVSSSRHLHFASRDSASELSVSEIHSVPFGLEGPDRHEDAAGGCEACGIAECSLEDKHSEVLVPRDVGDGCMRLNTLLDASPNLAHNYQLHSKCRGDSDTVSGSSGKSVVELLNYYSRPPPLASVSDQMVIPMLGEGGASSSGAACSSSSFSAAIDQFCGNSEFNCADSEPLVDMDPFSLPISVDSRAQDQPESVTNSIRVSLMALLHEEARGIVQNVEAQSIEEDTDHTQMVALQEEDGLLGEEPLALYCCVCMVRRKGAALIPCGHTFCRICAKQLFADRGTCPLCNNLIVQLLDIF